MAGTATSAGGGGSKTVDCSLVTPAEVNAALGTSVGAPSTVVNGTVTVCTYKQSTGAVIVRFDTASSAAKFAEARAGFGSHGETAVTASGFGDEAYTSTLGSGSYVTMNRPDYSGGSPAWERGWNYGQQAIRTGEVSV